MTATEVVWMVPGILGSELVYQRPHPLSGGRDVYWIDHVDLANDLLRGLELDANFQPTFLELQAGGPLAMGYQTLWSWLREWAAANGRRAIALGYDWRASIIAVGEELAARIRAESAAPILTHSIVGHSMGGLIARVAYQSLVASGEEHLVRRIVTLGAPHYGCYAPVRAWNGVDATMTDVVAGVPTHRLRELLRLRMMQVAATWWTLYQMLPDPQRGAQDDPLRAAALDFANYRTDIGLRQLGFTQLAPGFRTYINAAEPNLPAEVLTMVAGTGQVTPVRVRDPQQLSRSDLALGWNREGDRQIPLWSAAPAAMPGRKYHINADHFSIPTVVAAADKLGEWLLEDEAPDEEPVDWPGHWKPPFPYPRPPGPGPGVITPGHCRCTQ